MTWREWRGLWKRELKIDVPHADILLRCPYFFVRLIWYHTQHPFKAWPNEREYSLVIGWRWPFQQWFRERTLWQRKEVLPVAIYRAMDFSYLNRAIVSLGGNPLSAQELASGVTGWRFLTHTVKKIREMQPGCGHDYWIADCPYCSIAALRLALELYGQSLSDGKTLGESERKRVIGQGAERSAAHQKALDEYEGPRLPHETQLQAFQRKQRIRERRLTETAEQKGETA